MSGHKGKTYQDHATSLPHGDWAAVKDLLIALSGAVDQIQAQQESGPSRQSPPEAGPEPPQT